VWVVNNSCRYLSVYDHHKRAIPNQTNFKYFFISEFCLKSFHNEHYAGPPINQLAYTWTNIVACIWALSITLLNKLPLVQGRGYSSLSVTAVFGRNIN